MSDDMRIGRLNGFCQRLASLDTASRARLKRCAGRALGESLEVAGLFYGLLPSGVSAFQEETYFIIATLHPLADQATTGSLGNALRLARTDQNGRGMDRRVETLLDADESQLSFRLRQAIHFLQSNRVGVEWPRLLDDLLHWSIETHYVQKNWARDYYAPLSDDQAEQP